MPIKVYVSGICGSQEVRKQQQRVLFILTTMQIDLQIVDVTEPGRGEDRNFMQEEVKKHNKKDLLPPQIFNDNVYCGDYDDFQLAADDDVLMTFLKLEEMQNTGKVISNGHSDDTDGTRNNLNVEESSDFIHQEHDTSSNVNAGEPGEDIIAVNDEMNVATQPAEDIIAVNDEMNVTDAEPDAQNEIVNVESDVNVSNENTEAVTEPTKNHSEEEESSEEDESD